jgi:RNA polymerase sigma-70 factor (ECF subfamily)
MLQILEERTDTLAADPEKSEFMRMVDDHGGALLAMLRRLCGNVHDAEDVFQETAVRVWRAFANRPFLRSPRAWLMTIAYRAFVDYSCRRPRAKPLDEVVDTRHAGPESQAERSDESRRVQEAIATLSDDLRQVLALHYTGGLTLRQTAMALDVAEGTVKSRLNAALAKLRSVLQ